MNTRQDVALITGAASGIGRELSRQLSKRGWSIAALDQNLEGLRSLQQEAQSGRRACGFREADVTDAAMLAGNVAELESELGPVTLLVACAGVARETPAHAMDAGAIEKIIRINLLGVSNSIAAVLPGMLERRRGHVAAISSLASFRGLPCQMAYSASKAGLNALMESLRLDVRQHGIDVTTICPGWTRTPQTVGEYADKDLMPVEMAVAQILKAIDRRARFHAFPRWLAWQLRLMRLLPMWLQDMLVLGRMERLKKKDRLEPARIGQATDTRLPAGDFVPLTPAP